MVDGELDGPFVGLVVGLDVVGERVGLDEVGEIDGDSVGATDGAFVGEIDGAVVGLWVGTHARQRAGQWRGSSSETLPRFEFGCTATVELSLQSSRT